MRLRSVHSLTAAAMVGAGLMMAHQVAGKATRSSVFLSVFDASDLPRMMMAAALGSVLFTLGFSRLLAWFGPHRVVPAGFLASAVLHVLEWHLLGQAPRAAAPVVYLHIAGFGAVLLSGFWSMANEAFDPRSAKQMFGRIAGAGTAGGITGGLLAERVSALLPPEAVLLLLAALHTLCAAAMYLLPVGGDPLHQFAREQAPLSPPEVFRRAPHLRSLALLVLFGTAAAAMVDYLFSSNAAAAVGKGAPLLRFFAIYYTSVQVLTMGVQALLTRLALEKLGLSRTVGSLPMGVAIFAGLGFLFPSFPVFAAIRGVESILRSSLFRSGYELFYTPIAPAEKRVAKTIIDVGFDRAGDALGAGIVQALLWLGATFLTTELLGLTMACAVVSLYIASRLDRVYTSVIEKRLVDHAVALDMTGVEDSIMMSAVLQSISLQRLPVQQQAAQAPPPPEIVVSPAPLDDPVLTTLQRLRSGDTTTVLAALRDEQVSDMVEIAQVVRLLAWDEVADQASQLLVAQGDRITGLLIDHLLDPNQDFAIRRRVPRLLARSNSQRALDGLVAGLRDPRFEVRFHCARALDFICRRNPQLKAPSEEILAAVEHELALTPAVLASRRLLDRPDADTNLAFLDEEIRDQADKNLEFIFSLLATVMPREPLQIAFRSLHQGDRYLKGLAVEYLEASLPPAAVGNFRKLTELEPAVARRRSREEIAREMMEKQPRR